MAKYKSLEFEASCDDNGEFVCHSYRVKLTEKKMRPLRKIHKPTEQQPDLFQPFFTDSAHYSQTADDVFTHSYHSNFNQGNNDYINNMRQQFSQMRQSMLDQMESFTYVKNIKK